MVAQILTSDSAMSKFLRSTVLPLLGAFRELMTLWDKMSENTIGSSIKSGIKSLIPGANFIDAIMGDDEGEVRPSGLGSQETSTTKNTIVSNTINASKPLVLQNTNETTKEIGDILFNFTIDGTPLSKQFIKSERINYKREN